MGQQQMEALVLGGAALHTVTRSRAPPDCLSPAGPHTCGAQEGSATHWSQLRWQPAPAWGIPPVLCEYGARWQPSEGCVPWGECGGVPALPPTRMPPTQTPRCHQPLPHALHSCPAADLPPVMMMGARCNRVCMPGCLAPTLMCGRAGGVQFVGGCRGPDESVWWPGFGLWPGFCLPLVYKVHIYPSFRLIQLNYLSPIITYPGFFSTSAVSNG